jgi:hypothetical protein
MKQINPVRPLPPSCKSILIYLPIYDYVFQVNSFHRVSQPKPCIHLSSLPHVLHGRSILPNGFYVLFLRSGNWVRLQVDWPPSDAEIKNTWSSTSAPPYHLSCCVSLSALPTCTVNQQRPDALQLLLLRTVGCWHAGSLTSLWRAKVAKA